MSVRQKTTNPNTVNHENNINNKALPFKGCLFSFQNCPKSSSGWGICIPPFSGHPEPQQAVFQGIHRKFYNFNPVVIYPKNPTENRFRRVIREV